MKAIRLSIAVIVPVILIAGLVWHQGGSRPSSDPAPQTRMRDSLSHTNAKPPRLPADIARRLGGLPIKDVMKQLADRSVTERDEILSILTAEHGRTDPELALQYARQITAEPLRHESVALAIAFLFERDPRAALALLQTEADPVQRAAIETRLIPAIADGHAPTAIDLLAAGTMEAPNSPLLLAATVQRWAGQDAAAAAQWSIGIEDPELRGLASASIASAWARQDEVGLKTWLEAHPEARDLSAAYLEWRSPTTPEQREQLANQAASVPDGSISEPCPQE